MAGLRPIVDLSTGSFIYEAWPQVANEAANAFSMSGGQTRVLEKCHRAEPFFQTVKPVTLFGSFKSLTFRLWDEQRQKLVGYRALRAIRKQQDQRAL